MQTITEPSGCAVNNLNIFEIKSNQTNSDILKEELWVCNDNWKYLFQTYKVPQHNIQWSLGLVMPSAHCCTACTMHMIYHPHHRPTNFLPEGSLQRYLKEANPTDIAFFVQIDCNSYLICKFFEAFKLFMFNATFQIFG